MVIPVYIQIGKGYAAAVCVRQKPCCCLLRLLPYSSLEEGSGEKVHSESALKHILDYKRNPGWNLLKMISTTNNAQ
jgi:hypothetical protein